MKSELKTTPYNLIPDLETSEKDYKYLLQAAKTAQTSTDRSTKNGSVLVGCNEEYVIESCNCIPTQYGIRSTEDRLERPLKYKFTRHAESGAILEAARHGFSCENATLYVLWYACAECAMSLACSGVKRVVGCAGMMDKDHNNWSESIELGFTILQEANIQCDVLEKPLNTTTLMSGKIIQI